MKLSWDISNDKNFVALMLRKVIVLKTWSFLCLGSLAIEDNVIKYLEVKCLPSMRKDLDTILGTINDDGDDDDSRQFLIT